MLLQAKLDLLAARDLLALRVLLRALRGPQEPQDRASRESLAPLDPRASLARLEPPELLARLD